MIPIALFKKFETSSQALWDWCFMYLFLCLLLSVMVLQWVRTDNGNTLVPKFPCCQILIDFQFGFSKLCQNYIQALVYFRGEF